jgi:hypothetical protein
MRAIDCVKRSYLLIVVYTLHAFGYTVHWIHHTAREAWGGLVNTVTNSSQLTLLSFSVNDPGSLRTRGLELATDRERIRSLLRLGLWGKPG